MYDHTIGEDWCVLGKTPHGPGTAAGLQNREQNEKMSTEIRRSADLFSTREEKAADAAGQMRDLEPGTRKPVVFASAKRKEKARNPPLFG